MTFRRRRTFTLLLLLFACHSSLLQAQPFAQPFQPTPAVISELDANGLRLLDRSQKLAGEMPPTDAVESLLQVIDRHGTQLARVSTPVPAEENLDQPGFVTYWPANRLGARIVGQWQTENPAAAANYRQFVDGPLTESISRARDSKDFQPLQRALERFGGGTAATEGWQLLGEWHLDQGELSASLLAFQRSKGTSNNDGDRAAAIARLALVSLLQGGETAANRWLAELQRFEPPATGKLSGKEGPWLDLVSDFRQQLPSQASSGQETLQTFAGGTSRAGVPLPDVPWNLALQPKWTRPLPQISGTGNILATGRQRLAEENEAIAAYHPLAVGETVFLREDVTGQSSLRALNWKDGSEQWWFGQELSLPEERTPAAANGVISDAERLLPPHVGNTRYTLTVQGDSLFTRMGSPITAPAARRLESVRVKDQGWLAGLDLAAQGRPLEGFPLYPESTDWAFEGTPLVTEGRIFVLQTRRDGTRRQLHLACFARLTTPVDTSQGKNDGRPRGRLLWRTLLATGDSIGGGDYDELSHGLLAQVDNRLCVNTNLGVVSTVDSETGRILWLTRYPRARFTANPTIATDMNALRDLAPPVIAGQRVVFAPADCDQIFACGLGDGQVAWTLSAEDSCEIVHLLGAHEGQLIATGSAVKWIELESGRVVANYRPAKVQPLGRGLLAKAGIFWPTKNSIYVLPLVATSANVQTLRQIDLTQRNATGGNLAAAPHGLLIASGTQLYAFTAADSQQ